MTANVRVVAIRGVGFRPPSVGLRDRKAKEMRKAMAAKCRGSCRSMHEVLAGDPGGHHGAGILAINRRTGRRAPGWAGRFPRYSALDSGHFHNARYQTAGKAVRISLATVAANSLHRSQAQENSRAVKSSAAVTSPFNRLASHLRLWAVVF